MTKEDLDREHEALMLENGRLEEEHRKLEGSSDTAAHRTHSLHLRQHIERLHRYIEARGYPLSHPPKE